MKINTAVFFIIIHSFGLNISLFGQEHHFQIKINNRAELNTLTDIVSIDNIRDSIVSAYADEIRYQKLLDYGYNPLPPAGEKRSEILKMMTETADTIDWNAYPTHKQYLRMMNNFAEQYADICRLDTIGFSTNGRPILAVKISDNVKTDEDEPEFFYSGQIHGDELLTYMLLLHLIDHLLNEYGADSRITRLIDNTEIWINPLFNPDGTYNGQDTTVAGAKRFNANDVDLNRNFPDFFAGEHPDGNNYQAETLALLDFTRQRHFVMSANLHTGAELLNYPWDTWSRRAADDRWWREVCRRYTDTVRAYAPAGYLTDREDGITNGYDWYCIHGGRQDYMNYYRHCREVTMELSYEKMMPDSLLNDYWEYNKNALISYIEEVHKGLSGIISDKSGKPIAAKIEIPGYDQDNSWVFSDSGYGRFYRLLPAGSYPLRIEASGFSAVNLNSVDITDSGAVNLQIIMNHPPQIVRTFPQRLDTAIVNKGYLFNVSVMDNDNDSLHYGYIYGDTVIYDTTAAVVFTKIGRDSLLFFVEDGTDSVFYRWIVEVPQLTALNEKKTVIGSFTLKQNYPNPFNPITHISYEIPPINGIAIFSVQLDVYNILGQRVRVITDTIKKAGRYSEIFNAAGLSSGIYYYKLSVTDPRKQIIYFSKIKKMALLK